MKKLSVILIAFMALAVSVLVPLTATAGETASVSSTADGLTGDFLLDYGDGQTCWYELADGSTVLNAVDASLTAAGVDHNLSGNGCVINGFGSDTMGAADTGGSYVTTGTSGITVSCTWHFFIWNAETASWEESSSESAFSGSPLAAAYYPSGVYPTVTPEHRSAWTSIAGNAENTADQTTDFTDLQGESLVWSNDPDSGEADSSYSTVLYADGYAFVKYGMKNSSGDAAVTCYDTSDWSEVWSFYYPSASYETTTALIAGQYIFVQSTYGHIYRFEWAVGPGEENANVITFDGTSWNTDITIPADTGAELAYTTYGDSLTSMVFSTGCLFVKAYNGMVYCFDTDLSLVWSYQTGGRAYYSPPTVYGDYVAAGMYDGHLYILDKHDGNLIVNETVHEEEYTYYSGGTAVTTTVGSSNVAQFVEYNGGLTVFTTFDDGRGMSAMKFGVAVYRFDGTALTEVAEYDQDTVGSVSKQLCLAPDTDVPSVYLASSNGIYLLNADGGYNLISTVTADKNTSHSFPVLVNSTYLFISTYSSHQILMIDTDGNTVAVSTVPVDSFCMASVTVCEGLIISGNDAGAYAYTALEPYTAPATSAAETPLWEVLLFAIVIVIAALSVLWMALRFGLKWERPFSRLRNAAYHYFYGTDYTHNTRNKRRLWVVLLIGIAITLAVALLSLCLGPKTDLGLGEALSALVSSVQKGGHNLTYNEMLIYNSRLPRTVAALTVGIGLSVAGAVYQAVIKNPLVEPYIMGVSSGAGTLAIAVIVFDFTFFGLFGPNNPYLTVIAAVVGGLLAFGLTMLLAEKTGGKSINYVLAGIIVGLVFSAVQSLMMIMAGNEIGSALSWLYGSFASMTWNKVWVMLFPALSMSLVPLVWAKELNLVLLGEDQARQMGLNARRFDNLMLILVSVLTAFCVAFCGIIGFVGLVIPHLCRMILGGDHRLMLPACMAFGGFLMIAADLLARLLLSGYELPVGAITTIIGVPVFAYLLIRRGKSYEM